MEVIEVKNVLTNMQVLSLEKLVTNHSFSWYFAPTTLGMGAKKDKGQFVHELYAQGELEENYGKLILEFFTKLPADSYTPLTAHDQEPELLIRLLL